MICLYVCKCTMCSTRGGQKRASDDLGLELEMAINSFTRGVLCKSYLLLTSEPSLQLRFQFAFFCVCVRLCLCMWSTRAQKPWEVRRENQIL